MKEEEILASVDFVVWAIKTHPAYTNNLLRAYRRYNEAKGEEE
jgi:hypothetical protein